MTTQSLNAVAKIKNPRNASQAQDDELETIPSRLSELQHGQEVQCD